ncbi:MAG: hypothetical protein WA610_00390 [Thermodesulfovibrionales bacterium]
MDKKVKPAASVNVQNDAEQFAYKLYEIKENVSGSDIDNWLKAERIVAEWLKNREEAESTRDSQQKQPGT